MNFVDSGALLALHLEDDQYYEEARQAWRNLDKPVTTATHIIGEFATLLARRAGYQFSAHCVAYILTSPGINVLHVTRDDQMEALQWMRKYADQRIGFNDCVSFAIMKRLRIRTAFTFDRHFRIAGFETIGLK